jgi:hypothetical protein
MTIYVTCTIFGLGKPGKSMARLGGWEYYLGRSLERHYIDFLRYLFLTPQQAHGRENIGIGERHQNREEERIKFATMRFKVALRY